MPDESAEYGILTNRQSGILIETALVGGALVLGQLVYLVPMHRDFVSPDDILRMFRLAG